MNNKEEFTAVEEAMELIIEQGLGGMERAVSILLNEAMRIERGRVLEAGPYERTQSRKGYANGYKPKGVKSRLGELELQIPQVRGDVSFYPSALEKGERSERALKCSIAEMYIKGVTTRKVTAVLEKLCGLDVTSTDVSRATKALDAELEMWRNRDIGKIRYLILDARYEKTRMNGSVVSTAVLIAAGIREDGKRSILGVSVSVSEAETHWRNFLISLKKRGLHGLAMIASDDHAGLRAALDSTFSGVPWQRCQVHLQRNAAAYVPKLGMRKEVSDDIRSIFNAPDKEEAERLLGKTVDKYEKSAPKLSEWMENNIKEGLTVFDMPQHHRRRIRTTNMVERINREIKRRTAVSSLFPNDAAVLRLVSAILMEVSEEWESQKQIYLNMNDE